MGNMAVENKAKLRFDGVWSMGVAIGKYGNEGRLFRKDVVGFQMGYLFHVNSLDDSYMDELEPQPSSVNLHKPGQLLHGPFARLEYSFNRRVAPFIGAGAHLLALRGAKFDLNFDVQDNYYKQVRYEPNTWGRINPCFSGFGGLRVLFKNDWALAAQYEIFLRDTWTVKYKIIAMPATVDNPEKESSQLLTQKGWNQHVELRLQIPLR